MDVGDLLGDRFWLSPKKGKWHHRLVMTLYWQLRVDAASNWFLLVKWKHYVMKRCGQWQIILFFLHFGIQGVKIGDEHIMDLPCVTMVKAFVALDCCNTSHACWFWSLAAVKLSWHRTLKGGNKKRAEGWFKFSVQISLLELVYNTESFCNLWLFAVFATKND